MCHCSSAHPRHCSGFQPLFLPWCQHPLMPSSHSTDKKLDPSLRASAPSWLPRHLLGSQTRVLCPCGPLQSRARARPGSQPSPSLTQVWLKEPQHVCVLNPNSLLHQPAPSRGCKGKAWTLLPLFLTPTPDTRGFQWWRFQMRAWGRRINRKRLPSAGDGGGSRNFLASHREARRWHLGSAHKLPPTQRSQEGSCAAGVAPADWHGGSRQGPAELV